MGSLDDENAMMIYIQAFCRFQSRPEDDTFIYALEKITSHEMGEGPMRKVLIQEGHAKFLLQILWSQISKESTLDTELEYMASILADVTSKLSGHIPEMLQVNFLDEHPPFAVVASLAAQRQLCRGSDSFTTLRIILHVLIMLR